MSAALLVVAVAAPVSLAVLTGLGSRRRGDGWPLAVLSGVLFPLTWFVWYLRDAAQGG
ncbi:hypothetical protein [Nocardioides sp. SYSU DS0663]|uniref:hypothetical protein n=1 Tax=Nocardioides sp. SYSU DS0663 TaxID=3416445 RepID=UPI003F4B1D6C